MIGTRDARYEEANATPSRAACTADDGCSVGISAKKQQLFMSKELPGFQTQDSAGVGYVLVFSVKQLSDNSYVGTLSFLNSSDPFRDVFASFNLRCVGKHSTGCRK
jgi:hypothetical protein